jgi:hypothetical protein
MYRTIRFASWFVWLWNLVADIEGEMQAEYFRKLGADEGIWA